MTLNYIYKITNIINNKIYIGQTRKTTNQRWSEHISAATANPDSQDYNYLLHKAIRKYGPNNFLIETVEEIEKEELLSDRE
jgi:group I intron endonuclease